MFDLTDQFRYIKIHGWLQGLGEYNKRNTLFFAEPQGDLFCYIFLYLGAKYEFQYMKVDLLHQYVINR